MSDFLLDILFSILLGEASLHRLACVSCEAGVCERQREHRPPVFPVRHVCVESNGKYVFGQCMDYRYCVRLVR